MVMADGMFPGLPGATSRRVRSRARRRAGLARGRVRRFGFKTVVSSHRSSNTFKIFKIGRESFKLFREYSEAAIVEKEEL